MTKRKIIFSAITGITLLSAMAFSVARASLLDGSVLFELGGVTSQDNTNFYYNSTSHYLGIGTSSPLYPLDVIGAIHAGSEFSSFNQWDNGASNTVHSFLSLNPSTTINSAVLGLQEQKNAAAGSVNGVHGQATATNASGTLSLLEGVAGEADVYSTNTGVVLIAVGTIGNAEVHTGLASEVDGGYFFGKTDSGTTVTSMMGIHIPSNVNGGTATNNYGLLIDNQAGIGTNNWSLKTGTGLAEFGDFVRFDPTTFSTSTFPACSSTLEGTIRAVTNAATNGSWGATVVTGGVFHVLAYCDGTNWTVMAR